MHLKYIGNIDIDSSQLYRYFQNSERKDIIHLEGADIFSYFDRPDHVGVGCT